MRFLTVFEEIQVKYRVNSVFSRRKLISVENDRIDKLKSRIFQIIFDY